MSVALVPEDATSQGVTRTQPVMVPAPDTEAESAEASQGAPNLNAITIYACKEAGLVC